MGGPYYEYLSMEVSEEYNQGEKWIHWKQCYSSEFDLVVRKMIVWIVMDVKVQCEENYLETLISLELATLCIPVFSPCMNVGSLHRLFGVLLAFAKVCFLSINAHFTVMICETLVSTADHD